MKEVLDFPIGHEDIARNYWGKMKLEKSSNVKNILCIKFKLNQGFFFGKDILISNCFQ